MLTTTGDGGMLIPFIARPPVSIWEYGVKLNSFVINRTHFRRLETCDSALLETLKKKN